ncbi:GNAT family N-acetyltransferase [Neobacillus terrae]|uniref:GNAT family N-acetyltransferase n=1 Tax=Neobacillus terrae TaxID=3034837 RepID=UPI001409E67B|nr:GNAT family N-acetyltransferase [Neobacillus terrae]NHM30776.1 GNAT family N-acetyltransferase [Neobacillus terrae]
MTIRVANEMETDYILRLTGHVIEESTRSHSTNDPYGGYNMFLPLIRNGAYYLIEEESGWLKGWALIGLDRSSMTGKNIGNVFHLYVFPGYRNFGIGKNLIKAGIQNLSALGVETIQLNVFTGNPAKSLYEKLGFRSISTFMELNVGKS